MRALAAAAALLAAGALGAGCGGGGGTTTVTTTGPATATALTTAAAADGVDAFLPVAGELEGLEPLGPAYAIGLNGASKTLTAGDQAALRDALLRTGARSAARTDWRPAGGDGFITESTAVLTPSSSAALKLARAAADAATQGDATSAATPTMPGGTAVTQTVGDTTYATVVAPDGPVVVMVSGRLPEGETSPRALVRGLESARARAAAIDRPAPTTRITADQSALVAAAPADVRDTCGPVEDRTLDDGLVAAVDCVLPAAVGPGTLVVGRFGDATTMRAAFDKQVAALDLQPGGDCATGTSGVQDQGGDAIACGVVDSGFDAGPVVALTDQATSTLRVAQLEGGRDLVSLAGWVARNR